MATDTRAGPEVDSWQRQMMVDSGFAQAADLSNKVAARRPGRPGQIMSIRWQILATTILIGVLAGIVALAAIVYNAKRAAELEIAAAINVAEGLVREVVEYPQDGVSGAARLRELSRHIGNLRHVRILVTNAEGGGRAALMPMATGNAPGERIDVPRWFTRLVHVDDVRREMQIVSEGVHIGSVIIVGHAADEIAEVWQDTRSLALVGLVLSVVVFAMLYLALGRVLHPLTSLADGMRELEKGQFRHRLARPNVQELALIVDRFNALANHLGAAKADNKYLNHRLVTMQDTERRQIAAELHDELGPCLFGLKANTSSLASLAAGMPEGIAGEIRQRTSTLDAITDTIQAMNRRLLDKLRPIALDHLSLSEAVTGLLAEFQRNGPIPKFSLALGTLAERYDDPVNITIHRCLQEGITNVLRHAGARTIEVAVGERRHRMETDGDGAGGTSTVLEISIADDGSGIAPGTPRGLGLTGMEERVRALGGRFVVRDRPGTGTRLEISIPLEQAPQFSRAGCGADGT